MKLRRTRCFPLLVLLLLILAIPILAFAEDKAMIVQEIAVSNTPIKGTIEINKWGFVLKGFSENRDTLGYTVHTPLYQEDWLPGAVYEGARCRGHRGQGPDGLVPGGRAGCDADHDGRQQRCHRFAAPWTIYRDRGVRPCRVCAG